MDKNRPQTRQDYFRKHEMDPISDPFNKHKSAKIGAFQN